MEELDNTMIGRGRDAIDMIIDKDSFQENIIDGYSFDPDYGPGSVVGTAKLIRINRCLRNALSF